VTPEERQLRDKRWSGLELDRPWAGEAFDARYPDDLTDPNMPKDFDFKGFIATRLLLQGITCPRCNLVFNNPKSKVAGRDAAVRCPGLGCGNQVRLLAGTVFEGSHDLRPWFEACWLMVAMTDGISATNLSKALEIANKNTLSMIHSIQRVWAIQNKQALETSDKSFFGPTKDAENWIEACWIEEKICDGHILIILRMQITGGKTRRGKLMVVDYHQAEIIMKFFKNNDSPLFSNREKFLQLALFPYVRSGSLIRRHEDWSIAALLALGYDSRLFSRKEYSVKSVAAHFVSRCRKIYKNRLTPEYFKLYMEEFVYRFNTMRDSNRRALFDDLLDGLVRWRRTIAEAATPDGTTQNSDPAPVG